MECTEAAIKRIAREHNTAFTIRAAAALVMGVATTALLFGAVYLLVRIFTMPADLLGAPTRAPLVAASGVVAIGVLLALFTGNPFRALRPLNPVVLNTMLKSSLIPGGKGPSSPEHVGAGMLELLAHGPRALLRSLEYARTRVPNRPWSRRKLASVLRSFEEPMEIGSIEDPKSVAALMRLGLLKIDRDGPMAFRALVRTARGDRVARGEPSAA